MRQQGPAVSHQDQEENVKQGEGGHLGRCRAGAWGRTGPVEGTPGKVLSTPPTPLPGPLLALALGTQICLNTHVFAFPRSGHASKISGLALTDSFPP